MLKKTIRGGMLRPVLFLMPALILAASMAAGAYDVGWFTTYSGGESAADTAEGALTVTGTLGQHDAGALAGGDFSLGGGFEVVLAETPTPASTPTAPPGTTPTPTPEPGATATPTPPPGATATPTAPPGVTPTPAGDATPTPTVEPIRELIRSFYNLVLDREPEAGAVDSWHHGYFDYAVSFDIDVRFIPREMARLFFLSEEYAARNRNDGQFITDCYRVFLNREPSLEELSNWLAGAWNRSQVMTIFSESEEFASRIQAMYPGREGDPARNFVTFMYIGLLDRLVDQSGLEFAAGLFDAAYAEQAFVAQPPPAVTAGGGLVAQLPSTVAIQESDPGGGAGATRKRSGIEAVRAQAKQMAREVIVSPEFLGRQPTTADYVVRFYRAFLGRFPNDSEIAYWTGELDSGRRTTDNLIDLFADSAEFTERLGTYFGTP